jgi:RimJ/RimL family protein N-acetyltransferase
VSPILATERLVLRHFERADLDDVYRLLYADREVKDTWSGVDGTEQEIKARFVSRYIDQPGPFGFCAVCLKDDGCLIGLMGFQLHAPAEAKDIRYLMTPDAPNRRVGFDLECIEVELTYALGRPYWKQGYALEMGRALIDHGFRVLEIGRIIQGVLTTNPNSFRLMERLGFQITPGLDPRTVVGILERDAFLRTAQAPQ